MKDMILNFNPEEEMEVKDRLYKKLKEYVEKFNEDDEEIYKQDIDNAHALQWMYENIPLFECPDPIIEEIYYFRWWTFRKHIKTIPGGHVITEFLPDVDWSGPYNSINCANGFHIREGRWLRNSQKIIEDTIQFWLTGEGDAFSYSSWLCWAIWEYCQATGKYEFGISHLDELIAYFEGWKNQFTKEGLYWSIDDRDAMEYSISGSGYRPTLNSYMYGNAVAIGNFAQLAGKKELSEKYYGLAEKIKFSVEKKLWNRDFFQVIPADIDVEKKAFVHCKTMDFQEIPIEHNVKELIGYIPWYFDLPDAGYEKAFVYLCNPYHFLGKKGVYTADKEHPRYRYEVAHECLWNGPSWPYATTQMLVAVSNVLNNYVKEDGEYNIPLKTEEYFSLFKQYADSQYRMREDGKKIPWIDENLDGDTGEWISREILKKNGWKKEKGGYERGKDYNHSMFCDLVITGLLGFIPGEDENLKLTPKIPESWDYFRLEKLPYHGELYCLQYDKSGKKYGEGKGIQIRKE